MANPEGCNQYKSCSTGGGRSVARTQLHELARQGGYHGQVAAQQVKLLSLRSRYKRFGLSGGQFQTMRRLERAYGERLRWKGAP